MTRFFTTCPACSGYGTVADQTDRPVAVLSTTVLPLDGVYQISRVPVQEALEALRRKFIGTRHYVGHPATKRLLEEYGCLQASVKLFPGIEIGEWCLCFPIKQGQSDRSQGGTTVNQETSIDNLECRIVWRIA